MEETNDLWRDLPIHHDEEQVKLDVIRSFVYYPQFESEDERATYRADLLDIITYVLRRNPTLSYYQVGLLHRFLLLAFYLTL